MKAHVQKIGELIIMKYIAVMSNGGEKMATTKNSSN